MNDSNDFDLDDYDAPKDFKTELRFNDISIKIIFDIEESKKHIQNDYYVINNEGLDKIILEKFIPWLKGKDYLDRDNQKILEGLQLYEITYHYKKYVMNITQQVKKIILENLSFALKTVMIMLMIC